MPLFARFSLPLFAFGMVLCTQPLLALSQSCASPNADTDYILGDADGTGAMDSAMHWPTGLVWKRCLEGESFASGHCSTNAMQSKYWNVWAETEGRLPQSFTGQDNWGISAGFSQNLLQSGAWRMAYKNEILAIAENCGFYPNTSGTVFPDTPGGGYGWSGSPSAGVPDIVWYMDLGSGYFMASNRLGIYSARLVRGGQPFASLTSPAAQIVAAGTQVTFAAVTLARSTGAGTDAAWGGARISGAGNPQFQVNGAGGWVTEAIVKSGDSLAVRLEASATAGGGHTATLALRSGQTTGTSAYAANGGDEATAMVETTASFTVNAAGLTLPEGAQNGQPLGVALTPGNGWHIDSASTQTLASLGAPPLPQGLAAPHGLVNLQLSGGTAGSAATVVLTYPQALPPGTRYYKYGPAASPVWYEFTGAVVSGNTITLTLTDGANGDEDGSADGFITDPGGPVMPMGGPGGAAGIPTLSQWALALLAALMALAALGWLRGKRA